MNGGLKKEKNKEIENRNKIKKNKKMYFFISYLLLIFEAYKIINNKN
jgi:hypothetical protein